MWCSLLLLLLAASGHVQALTAAATEVKVWPLKIEGGIPTGDMPLFTAAPGSISLPLRAAARRATVEGVEGAFRILNVLSAAECERLLAVQEAMGFTEFDCNKNTHAALTWVADHDTLLQPLFERCRAALPADLRGRQLRGLNARFRCYRYAPDSISTFRPHQDDSFPCSGLDESGSTMLWDCYGDRSSMLTFLLYLTDEFEGGETTFLQKDGTRTPVKPIAGSALCFWQTCSLGDDSDASELAHLHEGSVVRARASGQKTRPKYVIRSDVLYSTAVFAAAETQPESSTQ
jgi:2OG-Fe(II) oxygenase superfamily